MKGGFPGRRPKSRKGAPQYESDNWKYDKLPLVTRDFDSEGKSLLIQQEVNQRADQKDRRGRLRPPHVDERLPVRVEGQHVPQ